MAIRVSTFSLSFFRLFSAINSLCNLSASSNEDKEPHNEKSEEPSHNSERRDTLNITNLSVSTKEGQPDEGLQQNSSQVIQMIEPKYEKPNPPQPPNHDVRFYGRNAGRETYEFPVVNNHTT